MPDGSLEAHRAALAFSAMDLRLRDYGLCYLRGGKGADEKIVVMTVEIAGKRIDREVLVRCKSLADDGRPRPREWSQIEIDKAARLHSRIIRLPLAHSLVLQTLYAEDVVHVWADLPPDVKRKFIADLTNWHGRPPGVNQRIARANRERGTNVARIRESEFEDIWRRAVLMLVNQERMLT